MIDDDRLPRSVREVLNVESGLNDGIATPVVTYCIAAAAAVLGVTENQFEDGLGAIWQLAIGIGVGAGVALVGGRLIRLGHRRGWMQHGSRRLATLAVALLAFLVASEVDGNPFVAAFIGGLVFGATAGAEAVESVELTELGGDLLSLVLWFVFGAGFILPAFEDLTVRTVLYAIASLTVVRMVPVAIALLGSGQDRATTVFVGWFGPAGWHRWCSPCSPSRSSVVATPASWRPCTPSPSRSCSASSPTGSRRDRWPPATWPRWPSAIARPRWADRPRRVTTAGRATAKVDIGGCRSGGAVTHERSPDHDGPRRRNDMSADRHARTMLPIPDRPPPRLTTYDAKDPDTSFPPIEPLLPPEGAPNVLIVLLDDVGFGASSVFGGPCNTPTAERLAGGGVRFNRFHTEPPCARDAGGVAVGPQPPFGRDGRSPRRRPPRPATARCGRTRRRRWR